MNRLLLGNVLSKHRASQMMNYSNAIAFRSLSSSSSGLPPHQVLLFPSLSPTMTVRLTIILLLSSDLFMLDLDLERDTFYSAEPSSINHDGQAYAYVSLSQKQHANSKE